LTLYALGLGVYAACVDFELRLGALLGLTYRDVNAGLFFVLWPLVTVSLVGLVLVQRRKLKRLERAPARRPKVGRQERQRTAAVGTKWSRPGA